MNQRARDARRLRVALRLLGLPSPASALVPKVRRMLMTAAWQQRRADRLIRRQ